VFSLLSCYFGHLKLIEPAILHLLLGYVLADGFGVPPNRINEKTSGPNPLPSVISLSFHVIRHDMPFFYPTFFMLRQSVKHLSQMFPYYSIQLPFPVLRNKYYVIFALPFCMTKTSAVFHGSFGFVALVGSQTHRTGRLLYKSNFRSLPGIAGGSPIDL
jgi:hypothetical protein